MALGALPQPADRTSIQKPNGTWKQSGKSLAPESSRELVGRRKPSMEADVYKQQLGWLVMESIGSRSSSRMRLVQKAHLDLDSAGEEAAAGATVGRGAGPSTRCGGRGQRLPHCASFNIKVQGTDLWLGSQHPWALAHALQEHAM